MKQERTAIELGTGSNTMGSNEYRPERAGPFKYLLSSHEPGNKCMSDAGQRMLVVDDEHAIRCNL